MAKELFIMFIYDTQRCQKEDDDPQDAVLYFHPTWVSDQQKLALCGQLMGATQFFLSAFSCPRIISLNNGKFVVQQFGQYILTVGSDRNIPDWILQHRADSLHSLVQFYHRDLDTISSHCSENEEFFNEKLHQIFETYVPIIQYAGNIFGTMPTIKLPKSASSVFLEALQILQCFQAKEVLGGTVLYQNKIVATQLGSDLTKKLVSTDPYRIKSPAEPVVTPFHLPVGVQLLYVYISSHEYNKLTNETVSARKAFQSIPQHKTNQKKVAQGKGPSKEPPPSMMKRDVSRIFTVPEEDGELEDAPDSTVEHKIVNTPDELDETETANRLPKTEEVEDSVAASASDSPLVEDKAVVNLDFVPQTPAEDVNINRVLHAKVLSICCGTEIESKKERVKVQTKKQSSKENASANSQDPKITKTDNKVSRVVRENEGRSASLNDLYGTSTALSKAIPMKCYSFGLPQVTHEMCEEHSNSKSPEKYFYNTLADPMHPCFRNDGLPISRTLFNEYLANHFYMLRSERSPDITPLDNTGSSVSREHCEEVQKKSEEKNSPELKEESEPEPPRLREKQKVSFQQEVSRRSLSLPLKTTTTSSNGIVDDGSSMPSCSYKFGVLESPLERIRPVNTLQLTPLMSKLSILANEEKTSSFYSQEATPCDVRELFKGGRNGDKSARRGSVRKSDVNELKSGTKNDLPELEKLVLFVCGQQNMALLLLMEEKRSQDPDLIHFLWEVSLSGLGQLEAHLHQCLEHQPQGEAMEPYSFICLDPSWDMLQRGGSWGPLELDVVSCLHYDFSHCPSLTEIVLRCEDSTVYGYQCGRTEVFYQQPVGSTPGLPTPADLMGTVPLKARRRLERDHGIILL